jgi:ABC-type transport system substrate-binding protein
MFRSNLRQLGTAVSVAALMTMARLATSWKQLDATTWRFKLRKGVKYSDGTPLTPEAISSSVDKALNPKLDCNARGRR